MDEHDRIIDAAVRSYPFAPLPAGFTRRLMKRIRPQRPAFRLALLDWLLPGFFGLFGVSTVAAILLTLPLLDPLWLPRLRLAYQVLLARMAVMPDLISILLPLTALVGMGLLVGLVITALIPVRSWVRARG